MRNSTNKPPTPSRLMATTNRPDTAPPRRAICSARFRLLRDAEAVRMLVRIDTHMPTYPAMAEHRAPKINDPATYQAIRTVLGTGSCGVGGRSQAYITKMMTATGMVY